MSDVEPSSLVDPVVRGALGMVPVVGPVLVEAYQLSRELERRRINQLGEELRNSICDEDLLTRKLKEEPRYLDLLGAAIETGRRTAWQGKRIAVARLLAHALSDDAAIDEDAALLAALRDLDGPHFRIMRRLEMSDGGMHVIEPPYSIPEPYLSALRAHGVLTSPLSGGLSFSSRGAAMPLLTPFGRRLLEWVREGEAAAGDA